jgi:hypothetical protein
MPCNYRRALYQPVAEGANERPFAPARSYEGDETHFPLTRDAKYTVSPRALQKWSGERVHIERRNDGSVLASFRFDGTTCSNMGRPLAFDYVVGLSAPEDGCKIVQADCHPAADDEGHKYMCAYVNDAGSLMRAIATEKPLLGRPLNDVLNWTRASAPLGCHCDAESRAHKWGLALEAIHYTLVYSDAKQSGAGFQPASEFERPARMSALPPESTSNSP